MIVIWMMCSEFIIVVLTEKPAFGGASPLRRPTKARPTTVCLTQAVYACQLVGRRQMHYINSAYKTGEMLMIACMQVSL